MANGSQHEGPARADRIREKYAKRSRLLEETIARELPSYHDEDEISEVKAPGVHARLAIPRYARGAIGVALAALITALAAALLRQ